MSKIRKNRFVNAIPRKTPDPVAEKQHGNPAPHHTTEDEQVREANETKEAMEAHASIRDRMVDIGRGNQQSGRQGQ